MEQYAFFLVNVILIVVCIIMSLVFIVLPLPRKEGLKSYRSSLRFLAISYFILAVLTTLNLLSDNKNVNFAIDLTTISLQTILFSFSLIILFNSSYANVTYVLKHIFPTVLYIFISLIFAKIWGVNSMYSINVFRVNQIQPGAVLNMLFLLFCIAQIIYFSLIFISQAKKYKLRIDNYFADTDRLRLIWVSYCFYGALSLVFLVIISMFVASPAFGLVITGINSVFYILFGLYYIQYPNTYVNIEPMFVTSDLNNNEDLKINHQSISWGKFKSVIIDEKYYLRPGVNIEEMAQYLKIGRTTLSNLINKEEKMNFHAWINTMRIEEAQQLIIANPDHSIAQVADMIGFSEPSNFSRQFKQITKQSPTLWKQKQMCEPEM